VNYHLKPAPAAVIECREAAGTTWRAV